MLLRTEPMNSASSAFWVATNMVAAKPIEAEMNTAASSAASRKLSVLKRRGLARHTKHVPDVAHGLDDLLRRLRVELGPQPADMALDHARARVEVHIPDVLEQHGAGDGAALVTHQVLEQAELLRQQIE